VARPLAEAGAEGAWYRDWRLMAVDGTCLDLADTEANERTFGRPGSARAGPAAFPQLRLVALAECGTHAIVAAAPGPYRSHEHRLAEQILGSLEPGMLCLADRGFCNFPLWKLAQDQGADLLWRAKTGLKLELEKRLPDGSWLSQLFSANDRRRQAGLPIRVIEYVLDDPGRTGAERYRLLTTILDPKRAPARELAAAYAQRWEFENALDELKTHQRGPRIVLRSKFPDGVYQEAYGYLLSHYAIRALMQDAAVEVGLDPDRLSFLRSLAARGLSGVLLVTSDCHHGLRDAIAAVLPSASRQMPRTTRGTLPPGRPSRLGRGWRPWSGPSSSSPTPPRSASSITRSGPHWR